jgi:drug/metabolite transporter (DMT)-like permease
MIGVSGLLKTTYSLCLQRSYRAGDFSLVYPLARGTGPLLATLVAIVFFGERPTPLALARGAVIIACVFVLTGGHRMFSARDDRANLRRGAVYGIITGVTIASYTLWDRHAVAVARIPPVIFDAGTALTVFSLTAPLAWRRRVEVAREWREHRREAFAVAVLSPVGYLLILTALSVAPVSYVAPAREVSIVIGAFLGARVLKETGGARRLWAAVAIVLGIIALALG